MKGGKRKEAEGQERGRDREKEARRQECKVMRKGSNRESKFGRHRYNEGGR